MESSRQPASALKPQTVLRIHPDALIQVVEGDVRFSLGDVRVDTGPWGLKILELFRVPQSLADATAKMAGSEASRKDWLQVSAHIYGLWQAGLLHDTVGAAHPRRTRLGNSSLRWQVRMLNDRTRTQAFRRAIRATVKPDDVVLDIGTGTGILALAAAQAGARSVYAMEMTGLADLAEAMFRQNDPDGRITLLRGRSHDLELPEKATVLVSEIIGNDPLAEGVLETFVDARQRLLTPDARILPQAVTISVVPVRLPADLLDRHRMTAANASRWSADYGVDYRAACFGSHGDGLWFTGFDTEEFLRCRVLGSPGLLTRIDLTAAAQMTQQASTIVEVAESGLLHGYALCFELEVGAGQRLSTLPPGYGSPAIAPDNAWEILVFLPLQPVELTAGTRISLEYFYGHGWERMKASILA